MIHQDQEQFQFVDSKKINNIYQEPYCSKEYDDFYFIQIQKENEKILIDESEIFCSCGVSRWCHPIPKSELEKIPKEQDKFVIDRYYRSTQQELMKRLPTDYKTSNGLCVPCLQAGICCFFIDHPSIPVQDASLSNISYESRLQKIEEKLNFIFEEVSPYNLGDSKYNRTFLLIMATLKLKEPILPKPLNIKYNFTITNRNSESDLIEPLLNYLNENITDYDAKNVSNGINLPCENVFYTTIFTLRPKLKFSIELGYDMPKRVVDLKGTMDIVCCEKMTVPSPTSVIFGIELELKLTQNSIRVAIGQLIGLNSQNHSCSPGIILTDLNQYCLLLYLDCDVDKLNYNIELIEYDNLDSAINKAIEIRNRKCITRNFSSSPTPPSTPRKSKINFDFF